MLGENQISNAILPNLLQSLRLLSRLLPYIPQVGRSLDAQLVAQLLHVPLQLLLPKHIDDLLAAGSVPQRPGQVNGPEPPPLLGLHGRGGEHAQAGHGQARVRPFEGLEGDFALADNGQPGDGVVEVVAFSVPLHDVRALLVVNVARLVSRVGGDALAVQPRDVGAADCVSGQGPEVAQGEGLGGDSRSEAEDATAGWVGEHGVTEAVDEVRRCRGFADGRDEVCGCMYVSFPVVACLGTSTKESRGVPTRAGIRCTCSVWVDQGHGT